MAVPTSFSDLSTTAASNSPSGSETPAEGDNHFRITYAFLRSIMDNSGNGWSSPYWALAATGPSISATTVTWSGNPTHSGNHTFSGNVSVQGNSTLGNAGTDTVTTNGNVTFSAPTAGTLITANGLSGASRIAVWNGSYHEYQLAGVAFGYIGDRTGVIGSGSGLAIRAEGSLDLAAGGSSVGLSITSDRRVFGTALHNNAGAITGTTNQYIASGDTSTWNPTPTNGANFSTLSSSRASFDRVGNRVNCSLLVTATKGTSSAGTLYIPMPIATGSSSNFCVGMAVTIGSGAPYVCRVGWNLQDDNAELIDDSTETGAHTYEVMFSYVVV